MDIVELLGDLNWLAVGVATLAYFALGGLWYMPKVFGDIWTKSMGWDAASEEGPGPLMYVVPLFTCFLVSLTLAVLAQAVGVDGIADGIVLGLVAGVGIAGAVLLVTSFFDPLKPKPMVWLAVTAGYQLVGILIAAVIVSAWR